MEKSMISLCLLGGLAIGNGFAQTPSKPNILLIIADDCSYYDIGCFGAVYVENATSMFLPNAISPSFVAGPSAKASPFLTISPFFTIGL